MPLTRALILRHASTRQDAYVPALLDVAQDHLLHVLELVGIFDRDAIAFKGGTSLRKCRIGHQGRFSTDIDLAVPNEDDVVDVCDAINNARIGNFSFTLSKPSNDARTWQLDVSHPVLGDVLGIARVECARRPLALPPERVSVLRMPIHDEYGFALGALPIIAEAEACAEKLARYRRVSLARDLYDLAWFAARPLPEALVRRLWVLKVYGDVVDDGRGTAPLLPENVLAQRSPGDFPKAPIGVLVHPADITDWEAKVRQRFAFLAALDADELRWAECNRRHKHEVARALGSFR